MKIRQYIVIIGISFLQIPILFAQECFTLPVEECADYWYCNLDDDVCAGYEALIPSGALDVVADNRWSLVINSINTDVETNEGNNSFHLGMCSECSDGYNSWEESDNIDPTFNPSIDLYFSYENGTEYNTDYRSIHAPDQLVVWDIAANIYGVDVVHLEWDFDDFIPQEYKIYFVNGTTRYNMRTSSNLSLQKEAFNLNGNETNIKIEIGICADTGYTTYYFDSDEDGWGSDLSDEYCEGYAPAGCVTMQGDIDDNCDCTNNTDAGCYDCLDNCITSTDYIGDDSGLNNECPETDHLGCDECGECGGNGVLQACGCGNPGAIGIHEGECD